MTTPQAGKTLLIYIAATNRVISTAIVIEREEAGHAYKVQRPIYFISKVLNAVLISSMKLRNYFETYQVAVVTEYPLGDILHNKEANGRIIKWAVEIGMYSIDFRGSQTIKS